MSQKQMMLQWLKTVQLQVWLLLRLQAAAAESAKGLGSQAAGSVQQTCAVNVKDVGAALRLIALETAYAGAIPVREMVARSLTWQIKQQQQH